MKEGERMLLGEPACGQMPAMHLLICSGLSSKLLTPVEILPKTQFQYIYNYTF